jgi:glucose/mannose-6-phosphate isomerase
MAMTSMEQLRGFVSDLDSSMRQTVDPFDCRRIVLCGMGGSGISSDIVYDCCKLSEVPIHVVKSPILPKWVGRDDMVLIASYSGNTNEVLENYDRCRAIGCKMAVMTSGGKLEERADRDAVMKLMLPKGYAPRHAIGYSVGYTLSFIVAAGGYDARPNIAKVLPSLEAFRESLELPGSHAMRLAEAYIGRTPVVFTDSRFKSAVTRWKTQFNENSKYVAFCDCVPSYTAADFAAWERAVGQPVAPTFIIGSDSCDPNVVELSAAADRLEDAGVDVIRVMPGGFTYEDDLFRTLMIGDHASIYMADIRGIDSARVRPIELLKERIKASGRFDRCYFYTHPHQSADSHEDVRHQRHPRSS